MLFVRARARDRESDADGLGEVFDNWPILLAKVPPKEPAPERPRVAVGAEIARKAAAATLIIAVRRIEAADRTTMTRKLTLIARDETSESEVIEVTVIGVLLAVGQNWDVDGSLCKAEHCVSYGDICSTGVSVLRSV